jgi:hypothetical protein
VNSGFADRGLTTWLPRRIRLSEPIRWLSTLLTLSLAANFRRLSECRRISGRQLRIIPYNGNRAYKYYLDGYKVNGKRKRLFFKDEATANRKLAELAKQQKKERQDGLDVPLDLRVMAARRPDALAPFNKSVLDAAEFYASHLERERSSILVSDAIEDYLSSKVRAGFSERHLRDIRGRIGRFNKSFGVLGLLSSLTDLFSRDHRSSEDGSCSLRLN